MRLPLAMTQAALLGSLAAADAAHPQAAPSSGRVAVRRHAGPAGARDYRLYLPGAADGTRALPLVVMLHGCTQDAADVARGTRLDAHAERVGALVVYPEQPASANPKKCWNWYDPAHQGRGAGEPAIVAGIVEEVMRAHPVDPARVYLSGISAGAAMAGIVAAAYPERFAALAVHSGVAVGAARSVVDALGVMARGPVSAPALAVAPPPLLVVQGADDAVVHPSNAEALAAQWRASRRVTGDGQRDEGEAGGLRYERRTWGDAAAPEVEVVTVQGLGHAWSGGAPEGTYTDARGPEATALVMRFLLSHRLAERGAGAGRSR